VETSLLELIQTTNAGQLKASSLDQIHYPEDGALSLESMELDHFWFVERRKIILTLLKKYLSNFKTSIGIDVGCGSGYTAAWLSENGIPTAGLDAHPGFAKLQNQKRGYGFVQGDIFSIEPRSEFDFVLLLDTIEHIQDDRQFVDQVCKMLKPEGILIMTVPAYQSLWSQVDSQSGHFRRYEKKDLSEFTLRPHSKLNLVRAFYFYATTLPLYLLTRKLAKVSFRSNSEQKPSPLINFVLKALLRFEHHFLTPLNFPFGSSLFAVFKKRAH